MKLLTLAVLSLTCVNVFAQSLDRDIQNKIDRLSNLANRGEVSRLSMSEKMDLSQQLSGALRTLRDQDDRRPDYRPGPAPMPIPMPGSRPGPGPGRPNGRQFDMEVTALISDTFGAGKVLTLGGRNPGDILSACVSQFSSLRMNTVSRIVLTANNNAYEDMRVFFSNGNDVCTSIVNKMRSGRPDWQFVDVSGTVADTFGTAVSIDLGNDRGEALTKCMEQLSRSRLNTVSKLTLSVNRGNLIQKNVFASGAANACAEIATVINQQLP